MDQLIHTLQDAYRRHPKVTAYAVVLLVILGVFACLLVEGVVEKTIHSSTQEELAEPLPATTTAVALSPSRPIQLIIRKLSIEARFEVPLGLHSDRTIEVPKGYTTVGWYGGGPTPGEIGPAIILGHVDSYKGAAVFYHLGQLSPGDTFTVVREDGSRPEFVVDSLERYPQSDFPTDRVYGMTEDAEIRLITCSGTYNKGTMRYSHNLVVYGHMVNGIPSSTPQE